MVPAVNVFNGKRKAAILTETVTFGRITSSIEIASVTRFRFMYLIIPMTIFACVGIQGLDVQHQVRGSASLYVSVGNWA